MANTYTTSKIVRLYDQRTPTKLLHPETELSAVVCTSGGLVVIADNDISVPASSVGQVISASGFIQEPIIEAATGGTVTNIGTSTGYGTLLKTISTTDTVRLPATSASNDYVPTELAVAIGLDRKQDVLSAGSFITFTPDSAGHDIIAVSPVVTEIRSGTSAVHTALPTEKAVQIAIGVASNSAVTEAMTSVGAAGYATQGWAQANFLSSGGPHDWGYANNQAAGVVKPIAGAGLIIGDSGALSVQVAPQYATYATASAGSAGIVRVTSEVVAAADATEKGVTVVPTTDAVYSAIQAHSTTQKPISSGSGITVTDANGSYTITLNQANATSLGGVVVPASGGLLVDGGTVTIAGATTQGNYTDAAAVPYAGVRVLSNVVNTTTAAYKSSGYVPSVQAVYDCVSGATAGLISWIEGNTYATETWVTGQTYATITYVSNTYVQQGTGPAINWGYATSASAGVVRPTSGLTVGESGILSAADASLASTPNTALNGVRGAVTVMTVIPTPSYPTGFGTAPIVPHVAAVYNYVSSSINEFSSALPAAAYVNTADSITMDGSTVYRGGVRIVNGAGLTVRTSGDTAGNLYVTDAGVGAIGGVKLLTGITTHVANNQNVYYNDNNLPTENAIVEYVSAYVAEHAGGGMSYYGDFAVSPVTGATTYNITSGRVWQDGVATSIGSATKTDGFDLNNGTTAGIIWLNISRGAGSTVTCTYGNAPVFGALQTAYPIAQVDGTTISQCQFGPIVIRGRWT